jgi:4-amino-4-deoxy-L-arabinose transferase-like glycosyltransferase
MTNSPSIAIPWAVLVLASVLFSANIWGYALWAPDEPRYAQVAREMLQTGDWLSPHVNAQPYREKPPLLFWSIAAVSAPFGDVSEWTARVPSILAAFWVLFLTYRLATQLYDPRVAFWAVLMLMTAYRFIWQARAAQIDMLLTACMTTCLYALWQWHGSRRGAWLVVYYVAMTAGLYAKGPPALVFPLLAALVFYWKTRADRRALHLLWGTVATLVLVGMWLVPARMAVAEPEAMGANGAVAENLFRQTIGRVFLGVSKAQPPWYYLTTLPVDWMPWTLFAPWILPWVWRNRREDDRMRWLLVWIVPAFILFSIFIGKRALYLLPIFPPMAIIFARGLLGFIESDRVNAQRVIGCAWALCLLVLSAAPWVAQKAFGIDWTVGSGVFTVTCVGGALVMLSGVVRAPCRHLHGRMAGSAIAAFLVATFVVLPVVDTFKSAKVICAPVRTLAEAGTEMDVYSLAFTREEYVFYAKHPHTPVLTDTLKVEPPAGLGMTEALKLQAKVRRALGKTTLDMELADYNDLDMELLHDIHAATMVARAETGAPSELTEAIAVALKDVLADFAERFESPRPAFAFVRAEDWLWQAAEFPPLAEFRVVDQANVGSRNVLLIANTAGAAAVLP